VVFIIFFKRLDNFSVSVFKAATTSNFEISLFFF